MTEPHDALVIGAGHNGLVTATLLARAGLRTLVLERGERVGGCAVTSAIAPGFRCPSLAHRTALAPEVTAALGLGALRLLTLRSDVRACAMTGEGRSLAIYEQRDATRAELQTFSGADAERYAPFLESVRAVTAVVRRLLSAPAPDLDDMSVKDLLGLFRTSRQFRALGRADGYRLLRWVPMPIADFTSEWFESEPLRALIASDGVFGSFLGPRSAGSTAVFLLRASTDAVPIAPGVTYRGGPGILTAALAEAARKAGAEVLTGMSVEQINLDADGVVGVVVNGGNEIRSKTVISSLDPRRTLIGMIDPVHLPPAFSRHVEHIRMRGTLAKVNYAVDRLPDFIDLRHRSSDERRRVLSGAVRLAPNIDAIDRAFDAAKYGRISDVPWIELTVPSVMDDSLAPSGQHVVSVYAQFAPRHLRESSWEKERDAFGELVTRVIDQYAPGFTSSIVARDLITPLDLEERHGLTGGHIFHGELALDQLLLARPVLGWARHRTPIERLFLCGAGTHPGIGVDGRSGLFAARQVLQAFRS